jgi:microcin C transport system ATP-binding protein
VFQDPFGALSPRLSVAEIIGEGLEVHEASLPRAERLARVAEASEVGLDPAMAERYPHEFSGGQRRQHRHCARYGAEAEPGCAG